MAGSWLAAEGLAEALRRAAAAGVAEGDLVGLVPEHAGPGVVLGPFARGVLTAEDTLPVGVGVVGCFCTAGTAGDAAARAAAAVAPCPEGAVVGVVCVDEAVAPVQWFVKAGGITEPLTVEEGRTWERDCLLLRVTSSADLGVRGSARQAAADAAIHAFEQSLGPGMALLFADPPALVRGCDPDLESRSLGDLLAGTKGLGVDSAVEAQCLADCTAPEGANGPAVAGPTLSLSGAVKDTRLRLHLDVVALCRRSASVASMVEAVGAALKTQLTTMCARYVACEQADHAPKVFHFAPFLYPVNVSAVVMVPTNGALVVSEAERRRLHEGLCLPCDRPLFRASNERQFRTVESRGTRLKDPHTTLKPSGVTDGKLHLVQGSYLYYHYMQDKFDDKGWGCAYRSLQTICSWFLLQGYVTRPVPAHEDIQKVLVGIDKPASFVGSKQWIGSQEVGWVLELWYTNELAIETRVISQVLGSDMTAQARVLAHHFDTQGTPIMIGGAQLAHTILGIDYNAKLGDLKFLILDPHYVGSEDLRTIQNKGWCAWKGPEFWKASASYNLCLPQRPKLM